MTNTPFHGRPPCACLKENRNFRGLFTFWPFYSSYATERIQETACKDWELHNFDRETEFATYFLLRLDFVPDLHIEDDYERRDNPYRTYIPGNIGDPY